MSIEYQFKFEAQAPALRHKPQDQAQARYIQEVQTET
jgi:acyl-CoA-binding protein